MLLEDQLPRIRKLIREKIGILPKNTIHNEGLMRNSFKSLYQALPRMIRMAINENIFVEFCMVNRERLLNISEKVSEKYSEAEEKSKNIYQKKNSEESELNTNNLPNSSELLETASMVFVPTYSPNLILSRGLGARVWDKDENEYIDLGSGISVNSSGHIDKELLAVLTEQAGKLWHTTNLYLTEPSIRLAEELVKATFADRVFFCNSGAEANEAAIKIARKFSSLNNSTEKREILTFEGSFHGRTLTTISATAQPKYQQGFEPLTEGFRYCPFNDFEAAEKMIGPQTCAVLIEPIQGEGGIQVPDEDYLPRLRGICDANDWLLIIDEVQSGNARTGQYFCYQHSGILPDLVTTAKGLGNGVPIGVCMARGAAAHLFKPGNHGSTFGGNPLSCAAANAPIGVWFYQL